MKKTWFAFGMAFLMIAFLISVSGCGETVRGIGKDFSRVGHGVKTIFIADS